MLGPYRVPAPADPALPSRCTDGAARCSAPRRLVSRTLSAATTTFLLVASASLSAITYSVVSHQAQLAAHHAAPVHARAPRAVPILGLDPLASLGRDTHAVEDLWNRAEQLAEAGADITLARASLPRARVTSWAGNAALRVEPDARAGGLRILDLGDRSPAALAGVRAGDVITALNGFPLIAPEDGARAFTAVEEARSMVAEIWREGRRVVLRVDLRA